MQSGALNIFSKQLGNVAEKVRQDMRATIVSIIESMKKIIPSSSQVLLSAALGALKAIASTMIPGEEYSLTSTVSLIITAVQQRKATSPALDALLSLAYVVSAHTCNSSLSIVIFM